MVKKYPPIHPKVKHMIHGADYNPDQWMRTPEVWDEDMRLMKLAHSNSMSVGIFAWAALEPEEGRFEFGWLDEIMEKLYKNNAYIILATPTGARPAWMSAKYPEVLRVQANRRRNLHGTRHNHCYTSPVYREKTRIINTKLAERYGNHPSLVLWHVSNEYGGECHCELCQEAFRNWLREKYDDDLDKLNHAWWTAFWSHTYTDWSQIESPAPHGEFLVHGHNLDWKRFVTHQTLDFFKHEIATLKEITPDIPVTTNFMGTYPGLDYWKLAPHMDVVSWDSYPMWHSKDNWEVGCSTAFLHDINRSLKGGKPFMLMESTPSATNWQPVAKLKRPGMHVLSSIQAVAHGSDSVQYFQWRKSRGSSEKFHGAVVDHVGNENTRVFRDVADVGKILEKLDDVVGTTVRPEVAVIYDWENRWAIDDAQGPRREKKDYQLTCERHYKAFWKRGIPVDVINMDCDFSRYKLLIAPMLYMVRPGVAERMEKFVESGGTLIVTYWSGIVDENDLCFLGGFPGPLRKVTGIRSEEIDALYDEDYNYAVFDKDNPLKLEKEYKTVELCDLIHAETAKVLATYKEDFYAGRPALTVNEFGKGKCYYIAFRSGDDFLSDFYGRLIEDLDIQRVLDIDLPEGVTAQKRSDGDNDFIFVMNFAGDQRTVDLGDEELTDMIDGGQVQGEITLPAYGLRILKRPVR
ncbi:MAG: beta-galactosidase [Caldicoprobacterales bacterium]